MRTQSKSQSLRVASTIPFLILVFFWPPMSDPFNLPKLMLLILLAFVAISMFFVEVRVFATLKRIKGIDLLYLSILGFFLISITFSLSANSHDLMRSLLGGVNRNNGLLYYLSMGFVAFVIVCQSRDKGLNSQIRSGFYLTSFVLAVYGFIQFSNIDFVKLENPYNRITGTLGNPNFSSSAFAIFGVALLFFAFNELGHRKHSFLVYMLFTVSISLAFLSWATESLQGILIYSLGGWLTFIRFLTVQRSKAMKISSLLLTLLGMSISIFSFLGLGPFGAALEQYTLKLRSIYASYGLKALAEKPLTGLGADEYLQAFLKYRSPEFIDSYGIGTVTDNAHSVPINIGANFGIIAMISFLILQLIVIFKSLKCLFFTTKASAESSVLSLISLLLILQSWLSIEQIGLGCAMWLFGAMVIQGEAIDIKKEAEESRHSARRNSPLASHVREVATILLAFGFIPLLQFDREDKAWKNIVYLNYSNDSDASFVFAEFRKLSSITLSEPRKVAPLVDNLLKTGDQETTFALIESNYLANPRSAMSVELMANVRAFQGLIPDELQLLKEVVALDPLNYKTLYKYGKALQTSGDRVLATSIYREVIDLAPKSEEARLAQIELGNIANDN
jgi:tetratricopeptide (TPR) repeat protein